MLNETHDPDNLRLICTYPTTPAAGGVVIYGDLCGIAEGDEDPTTGETVVKLGPWVGDLEVTDINTGGIAKGDPLFASKATPVVLSNLSTGVFFGWANEAITTGATATIEVIKDAYAGGVVGAGSIGATQLAAQAVTEAKVQVGAASAGLSGLVTKFVADKNVIGGIPVIHRINIAAGATGNTDVTLTHKTHVMDAWLVLKGAGVSTTTLQVKNGTNAITDAMAASGSDQAVVRAASIDDAYNEIAAGGTLRVTSATGATQPDAVVYVLGFRVA
jgi:hypothetical protein